MIKLGIFFCTLLTILGLEAKWAPDYMIIGAQKAGTTAVFDFLNQHPHTVNKVQEVHFFDDNYEKGEMWYWKQFPLKPSSLHVIGDKSPYYLFHPLVPQRVYKKYPKTRFIVVLRNPVDRAYSQYWMNRRQGTEKRTFWQAVEEEPSLLAGEEEKFFKDPSYKSNRYRRKSYLARGYYAEQLVRWFTYFPREQFFFVKAEDLRKDPQGTMNKLFNFLGLHDHELNLAKKNKKSTYSPMNPELREILSHHFKSYNEDLEALLGETFDWDE